MLENPIWVIFFVNLVLIAITQALGLRSEKAYRRSLYVNNVLAMQAIVFLLAALYSGRASSEFFGNANLLKVAGVCLMAVTAYFFSKKLKAKFHRVFAYGFLSTVAVSYALYWTVVLIMITPGK